MSFITQSKPELREPKVLPVINSQPFEELATMPSSRINRALQQALNAPDGAQNMARFVTTYQRHHPQLLTAEQGDIDHQLAEFLTHYVRLLPTLLVEVDQVCQSLNLADVSQQLLVILDQFFAAIEPSRFDYGLVGVLDKVYFGHRLVEELHDQLMMHQGQPLISWDTTLANLLVHTMVGDNYANRLDMTAQEVIGHLPAENRQSTSVVSGDVHWPCLIHEHHLKLMLS